VEAFLSLLRPFGILESARTGVCPCYHQDNPFSCVAPVGVMVMARTPISAFGEEETTDKDGAVDASLLPPG